MRGCFSGTPRQKIGNVTISTIKRSTLLDEQKPTGRGPLRRLGNGPAPAGSGFGLKRLSNPEEGKENLAPDQQQRAFGGKAKGQEYRFGDLFSSPGFPTPKLQVRGDPLVLVSNEPVKKEQHSVDWEALDCIIKQTAHLSRTPSVVHTSGMNHEVLQSEADEIESLLFSQDPFMADFSGAPDIFLGYDEHSDGESPFHVGGSIARPRSSSILSVHSVHSQRTAKPSLRPNKIEVKIRACKKDLPALKTGSQLKKMVLAGDCPGSTGTKRGKRPNGPLSSDRDDPEEYTSFITKLRADEPVESDASDDDDEFRAGEEDPEDEDQLGKPVIPRREIECLFEDSNNTGVVTSLAEVTPVDPEELGELITQQFGKQFRLLVQMLALCGEIKGAEENSIIAIKMISQLRENLAPQAIPEGINYGMETLLRNISDPAMRAALVNVSKKDPALRSKSSVKSLQPIVFKHSTLEDPCHLSPNYHSMISLFRVALEPSEVFNPLSTTLIDNTGESKRGDEFLKSEDALLLLGLKKFGLANWEMIQAQLLPIRSSRQLYIRYKNLVARRAASNPIKDFVAQLWRPLSKAEEDLIYRGVLRFGRDFKLISSHFLPHRPPTILRNLWGRMNQDRRSVAGHIASSNSTQRE